MQQITDFGARRRFARRPGTPARSPSSKDIADDKGWASGQTIPVRFAETGAQQFTVGRHATPRTRRSASTSSAPRRYDANIADRFDSKVLMKVADGVDFDVARAAVTAVAAEYPQGEVQDRNQYRDAQTKNMDMLLNLIYALLALAVFIALLGIANTLALSIFERTRELGLLRAVGMTRRQLRATVRYESVIIALLGTTLGLAIGTAFGWSIVKALESEGLDTFAFPVGQLGRGDGDRCSGRRGGCRAAGSPSIPAERAGGDQGRLNQSPHHTRRDARRFAPGVSPRKGDSTKCLTAEARRIGARVHKRIEISGRRGWAGRCRGCALPLWWLLERRLRRSSLSPKTTCRRPACVRQLSGGSRRLR